MSNIIPFPYQGQPVRFSADGWINATDIAKRFGKRPVEWLRLPTTLSYMEALAGAIGEVSEVGKSHFGLVDSRRGGKQQGTWIHPKLAVHFARWLDDRFAVWCDMQIDTLLRSGPDAWRQLEIAEERLEEQNERGSNAGRELARHRWKKPPMVAEVEYWRDQLQMPLALDAA
ncbi:KilA-N domain-containing protein [Halomonas sp. I1]|uniref:KilA-N domain-containing protein n=1 Tax=Halomonas sp. I1 TaxID=393536 RepID=UPI0028DD7C2E|nr:KilA-N domain-containing protein [Halomonas sp. I1]MDT8894184.1 KilA-N domain-containing protein [Halomonas sp. I1]